MLEASRIIVFVKNMSEMLHFYETVLGLARQSAPDDSDEFVSLDVVKAHFPRSDKLISGENDWSYEVVKRLLHAPGSPTLAQRIWPAVS